MNNHQFQLLFYSHLHDEARDDNGNEIVSKLTGQVESKIFMVYEWNELEDRKGELSDSDKANLIRKIKGYVNKYTALNENDGQSTIEIYENGDNDIQIIWDNSYESEIKRKNNEN